MISSLAINLIAKQPVKTPSRMILIPLNTMAFYISKPWGNIPGLMVSNLL